MFIVLLPSRSGVGGSGRRERSAGAADRDGGRVCGAQAQEQSLAGAVAADTRLPTT